LKQARFTILQPNGLPDYQFETVNGVQVKSMKVNRPKALCFDYLQLKDMFGLELETEVVTDTLGTQEEDGQENGEETINPQHELPF